MTDKVFPLFVSLQGKRILLVGAGSVAARRAEILLSFGARLYVVAPECSAKMEGLCEQESLERLLYWNRCFEEQDLDGKDIVIAATDNAALNHEIVSLCRRRGILANNASSREDCDFFFPAILQEDGLTIGVSSNGDDPGKVAAVCGKLRRFFANAGRNLHENSR